MEEIPDPNILLPHLQANIFNCLAEKLNANDSWKKVARILPNFSSEFVTSLEKARCPSTELLEILGRKNCTVEMLCDMLSQCQLYDPLALLSEPRPLQIEEQPDDDSIVYVPLGGQLKLKVVASGVPPPLYQWLHDNERLDQLSSVLLIDKFGPENEGDYRCLILQENSNLDSSDEYNCISSNTVCVHMLPLPPVITEQPKPVSSRLGENITLSCQVSCYPPPHYEWLRDNIVLEGQNNNILNIQNATLEDSGTYFCHISNKGGEIDTDHVRIFVNRIPEEYSDENNQKCLAEEKVALLIANESYENLTPLRTPSNDVKALSSVLKQLGFKVLALRNLNRTEMINALKTFCKLLPKGAYGLFYFVGHGFEWNAKYMLPVDCPGSDSYRCSDSLCEREVLKEVSERSPQLCILLLDMCLTIPKREENPGIFGEQVFPVDFNAQRNLVHGYATTSSLGAYERATERNGIYVKHLLKFLDYDMPIEKILGKVNGSISNEDADAADLQIPSFSCNTQPSHHYLTAPAKENKETKELYESLTTLNSAMTIHFKDIKEYASVKFHLYSECFHNAIEIRISGLEKWHIICQTQCKELKIGLERDVTDGDLIIYVHNLQKLKIPLPLSILLFDRESKKLIDTAFFEVSKLPIASAQLWFDPQDYCSDEEDTLPETE